MSESAAPIAQIVETMRALAGPHPGFRPVHAKGLVCYGTFRGAPSARGVTRAPHLQGEVVPTVIRFSNAGGNPDVHDGLPAPRAMAVKFQLPDGKNADILGLSIEGFPARTPEDFLAFLQAQAPRPGYRTTSARRGAPLSGEASVHCGVHRAPDAEAGAG